MYCQKSKESFKYLHYYYDLTLINRNILPILKTRTTLRSVGDTGKSIITSSMSIPITDAKTSKKSKTFQGTVK